MIERILENNDLVLMEASVVERLRRNEGIELHPTLVNAPLIYDHEGKNESEKIYREYIDIAKHNDKPIFICTPTWRANWGTWPPIMPVTPLVAGPGNTGKGPITMKGLM